MSDPASSPLHTGLLAAVSRSFYLSLLVLPRAVRGPLSLGYLLARAADTIADVPARPAVERLALLAAFDAAVQGGECGLLSVEAAQFSRSVTHAGERTLLERLGECFAAMNASTAEDRSLTRTVLGHIVRGQSIDLRRFPGSLTSEADLEEYTWLVAGCVGEFWTKVCLHHLPRCAMMPEEGLLRHAVRFGQALQLINILRDQPKDMAEGRCYLPEEELSAAGLVEFTWPSPDWKPWHAVRRRWLAEAREKLVSGREYVRALKVKRLRLAALLPLLIGEATLDLLEAQPDDAPPQAAKVPRSKVKRIMLRAMWLSVRGC